MYLRNFFLLLSFICTSFGAIRLKNASLKNLAIYTFTLDANVNASGTLVEAGSHSDILTVADWSGLFYAYPEECLNKTCDYPVTRVRLGFGQVIMHNFYDIYAVDINSGFNIPAAVSPLFSPKCRGLKCIADIIGSCPEEDQVKNDEDVIVSCKTSSGNYQKFQELCPEAIVDGPDPNWELCYSSSSYEITFG